MKFTSRVSVLVLGFITFILICVQSQLSNAQPAPLPDFAGRYIATISDGDFLASTYGDGQLPAAMNPDRLSVIPLPLNGNRAEITQVIQASSSVDSFVCPSRGHEYHA